MKQPAPIEFPIDGYRHEDQDDFGPDDSPSPGLSRPPSRPAGKGAPLDALPAPPGRHRGHRGPLREVDALDLLVRDHHAIERLFRDYRRLTRREADPERKAEVAGQICFRLSIHMQIEERLLYPAARIALASQAVFDHALDDHHGAKELIVRLDEMEPDDADYDATVAVIDAYIGPHMAEEQAVIFPALRRAGLDMAALGREMAQLRQQSLHQDVTRIGLPQPARGAELRTG